MGLCAGRRREGRWEEALHAALLTTGAHPPGGDPHLTQPTCFRGGGKRKRGGCSPEQVTKKSPRHRLADNVHHPCVGPTGSIYGRFESNEALGRPTHWCGDQVYNKTIYKCTKWQSVHSRSFTNLCLRVKGNIPVWVKQQPLLPGLPPHESPSTSSQHLIPLLPPPHSLSV